MHYTYKLCLNMMTSSNGNSFRITGHLCGDFTGPRWNSPQKGQWRGALMFSLISARINGWVKNREAGDLRPHPTHCYVIVMNICLIANTGIRVDYFCLCRYVSMQTALLPTIQLIPTWVYNPVHHSRKSGQTHYRKFSYGGLIITERIIGKYISADEM